MIVLGLKCLSHDNRAAIIGEYAGGLVVHAISEARLNRRKHSFAYPLMSISFASTATWKFGPKPARNSAMPPPPLDAIRATTTTTAGII